MNIDQPYRILVIDDDESLHGVYSAMLERSAGMPVRKRAADDATDPATDTKFPQFEIDFAFQGQDGLVCVRKALAERRPYTMAFVDMRMPPGWDGIETISHIWRECHDLQIVICTGHADFSWHDLIKQFGHSDRLLILRKPFDIMELRQVAYSLAEKSDLAHQAESHLQRLQRLVSERTAKLEEANLSLQRKMIENKKAERRLVTQYSVSQALAEASTLAEAVDIIFQIVCSSLDWEWGGFWQADTTAKVLKLSKQWHVPDPTLDTFAKISRQSVLEAGIGVPGRVWKGGEAVWVQDLFRDEDMRRSPVAVANGLHAATAFPVCAGGTVVGVMEFLHRDICERDGDVLQTFAVIGSALGQFIERKQAEEDLKRERDYIGQIIGESPSLIVGIAPDGATTFVNPAVARHTGYSADEVIGRDWWRLFYPGEEYQQVQQLFGDLEKGPVRNYEMQLTTKTGAKRTVSWNSLSKFDETGRLIEIIGFGNDVSERKEAEAERSLMEIQLRHAQKLESIGQLAAGIAHEINTPTQYISDNIHFLQTSFGDLKELNLQYDSLLRAAKSNELTPALVAETEAVAERANVAFLLKEIPAAICQSLEGLDRVTRIVSAMKDFSHPGTNEKTPIDLNKAIASTLTVAANEWKYIATIQTDFDPNLPLIPCLPGELNQVVLNLVVNAAHAIADAVSQGGKSKGVITAGTKLCGDCVEISIRDTGTGIPDKIRDKIFDPFFTTKPVGKGTGQGLAIAHTVVVDQHQGQLTFESEMGVGSVFKIRLPLNPVIRTRTKGMR